MDLLLALDAGTTGVRTVAFDHELRVVDQAYRELTPYFPGPGLVEHDAAEIADLAVATLREVAERAHRARHRVLALGLTNQRETTVAFDRDTGHLPHHALVWQDRRGEALCEHWRELGHRDAIRATSGLELDAYFAASKMRWFLDRGLLDRLEAPALATVDTWLLWWLTGHVDGGVFVTEPSNASRTMLLDLDTLDWSTHLLQLTGLDASLLARVGPSSTAFGVVSADVIPELAGVPITGVLGDQQAALFGQACFLPGDVKVTYGTGAFVLANAGAAVPEPANGLLTTVAWDLGAFGPATYALEGAALVAGAALLWLRDEVGLLDDVGEFEALATSVPDSAGALFIPALAGLGAPFWRSSARGALLGLSSGVTRAHVARAVLEALVFQVRAMTDAMGAAGLAPRGLRADGGLATMDALLAWQSGASGVPVQRSASVEATARGAASIAGLEIGWWPSLEDLAERWRPAAVYAPDALDAWSGAYARWLDGITRA